MSKSFYQRDTCRLCGGKNLENVLPLAPTALCDAYVPPERVNVVQEIYPLDLFLCRDCGYVFLPYVVDPEIIYLDYIYVTTSSMGLADHFKEYADEVMRRMKPSEKSLTIDLGSNDGTLLKYFKQHGMRVLGIEPAHEIAREATESGIKTLPNFFNSKLADSIKSEYGSASIITINNLFANIDDLYDVTEGVRKILAPDGVFILESSYLGDMIRNMVFDFIYHEHLSYLSVKPLMNFFRRFDMEIIDIERVPTKGGSLRYYIQKIDEPRPLSPSVSEMEAYEDSCGLDRPESFKAFAGRINKRKSKLVGALKALKSQGKSIAGYGGSATSTTLVYHFDIGNMMDYIADDNPAKHNTLSPGLHIPVLPSDVIYERRPDYIIMLAWRYFDPIAKKHQAYMDQGGHFIRPLPDFEIVGSR